MKQERSRSEVSVPRLLEETAIQDLIESRGIRPEHVPVLEMLATCPKKLFHDFHNTFNLLRERSFEELSVQRECTNDPDKIRFLEQYLILLEAYDWSVCWMVNLTFERRQNT
jgi:hypothetical protein